MPSDPPALGHIELYSRYSLPGIGEAQKRPDYGADMPLGQTGTHWLAWMWHSKGTHTCPFEVKTRGSVMSYTVYASLGRIGEKKKSLFIKPQCYMN